MAAVLDLVPMLIELEPYIFARHYHIHSQTLTQECARELSGIPHIDKVTLYGPSSIRVEIRVHSWWDDNGLEDLVIRIIAGTLNFTPEEMDIGELIPRHFTRDPYGSEPQVDH